jgi:hypothetical protein
MREVSLGFMSVTGKPVVNLVIPEIDQSAVQRLCRAKKTFEGNFITVAGGEIVLHVEGGKPSQERRIGRIHLLPEIGCQVKRLAVGIADQYPQPLALVLNAGFERIVSGSADGRLIAHAAETWDLKALVSR